MKKCFLFVISISVAGAAFAEIDDETAKARALEYAARIGYTSEHQHFIVFRESNPPSILVTIDERVNVIMRTDGSFRSYSNPRPKTDRSGSPDHLADDESAWRAAEAILAKFEVPTGLARHRIVRELEQEHANAAVYCHFNTRPYGYQSWAGNSASVRLDQTDGTPTRVIISSGWTYEPPNIRVSQQQAITKAQEVYGGSAEEWHVELMYMVGASQDLPQYIREMAANKIQRLCYSLSRDTPDNSYGVWVDSVTGQVLSFGETGSGHQRGVSKIPESGTKATSNDSLQTKNERSSKLLPYSLVAIVVALSGLGTWLLLRNRTRG